MKEGVRQISSSSLFEMGDQNREMRRSSFLTAALMAAVCEGVIEIGRAHV